MSNEMSLPEDGCIFRLEISGGFLLLISATGFLCGGEAVFGAFLAASAHELGHLVLILWQGNLPRRLTLDISGACLRCCGREPGTGQELLRALAGPGTGLLLWLMLHGSRDAVLGSAAGMSLMLSLVNLLPATGLDGGRILECLLSFRPGAAQWDRLTLLLGFLSAFLTLTLGFLRSPQLFLYGLWLLLRQLRICLYD